MQTNANVLGKGPRHEVSLVTTNLRFSMGQLPASNLLRRHENIRILISYTIDRCSKFEKEYIPILRHKIRCRVIW